MKSRPYGRWPKSAVALHLRFPAIAAIAVLLFSLLIGVSLTIGSAVAATMFSSAKSIPRGYSSTIIQVKFNEGTNVESPETILPQDLSNSVSRITRLFSPSKNKLNDIRERGKKRSAKKLPDLNLWFQITLKPGTDSAAFIESLKR